MYGVKSILNRKGVRLWRALGVFRWASLGKMLSRIGNLTSLKNAVLTAVGRLSDKGGQDASSRSHLRNCR